MKLMRIDRAWPFVLAATLFMMALPAAAQQPGDKSTAVSKAERLGRAPVSKEMLRVNLPKPFETTLPNGLRVLILEDHRFPLVDASLIILGAGATSEPPAIPGLASTTAAMLKEGTSHRGSKEIAEETEQLGAVISFFAPFGGTSASMSASGLSDNFDTWFALALDQLLSPTFPSDELGKLKERVAVRLKNQRTSPQFLMRERTALALYCTNPDDRSTCLPEARVTETAESLDALTPDRLADWHRQRYVPQNGILAIAGDVDTKKLVAKLTADLGGWERTERNDQPPPRTGAATARRVFLVDRPNSVQTTLWLGNVAIDRRDADYIPVVVANRVLGGGAAARLFLNLREEKGYTYGVYSGFTAARYAGAWAGFGDVRPDATDGALHEFMYELTRLGKDPVPDAELDDARRSVVASFALSLEQPDRLIGYATDRTIYSLAADYWDTYPAEISAVSAADVTRVAAKYLDPDKLQIIGVGEAKQVLPAFQKYGAVKLYDTQGRPEVPPATPSAGGVPSAVASAPNSASVDASPQAQGAAPVPRKITRINVGGKVQQAKLVYKVPPSYPVDARQAGVSGTVRMHLILDTDGTVKQLELISGHKLLIQAAMDAVRQWRYQPTLLNGEPVEVETFVDVVFMLG